MNRDKVLTKMLGHYLSEEESMLEIDRLMDEVIKEPEAVFKGSLNQLAALALTAGAAPEEVKEAVSAINSDVFSMCVAVESALYKQGLVDGLSLMGIKITMEELDAAIKDSVERANSEAIGWMQMGSKYPAPSIMA